MVKVPWEQLPKHERKLRLAKGYGMGKSKLQKMAIDYAGQSFTTVFVDEAAMMPDMSFKSIVNPITGARTALYSSDIAKLEARIAAHLEEEMTAAMSGRGTPNINLSAAAMQQLRDHYNQYMNGALGHGLRQAYQAAHGGPTIRTNSEYWRAYQELTPSVTAGEITGYRAWSFNPRESGRLKSITADVEWDYEQPMIGDVREWGIYSFKDPYHLMDAISPTYNGKRIIYGQIKMWGEVIEHEKGHRAQFARIHSLDYCKTECFLKMARHNYKFIELNEDEKREMDDEVRYQYNHTHFDSEEDYRRMMLYNWQSRPPKHIKGGFRGA